jgi:hypothetical protein
MAQGYSSGFMTWPPVGGGAISGLPVTRQLDALIGFLVLGALGYGSMA